jgi:hypothetical protein|tara:strand:+ start:3333 stop:3599 length:267 start_codon:yes stop_codon:yes gene_type:complete
MRKSDYTDQIMALHRSAATVKQLAKIQVMTLELQKLAYESGADFVAPIILDASFPMTKKEASNHIEEMEIKLDEWQKIVRPDEENVDG